MFPVFVHADTCESYVLSPGMACGAYVGYSYVLPANTTQMDLDLRVMSSYSSSLVPFTNSECVDATLRFACALEFRPCVDNSVEVELNVCQDLCVEVQAGFDASKCYLPVSTYSNYNCSEYPTTDCNSMTGTPYVAMKLAKQTYEGAWCAGLVDEVFVPPGMSQIDMETDVGSFLQTVPIWLDSVCLTAARKMFCSLAFMPAQTNSMARMDVYLPQLPSNEMCLDYNTKCLGFEMFVQEAYHGTRSVSMNCSEMYADEVAVLGGHPMFPTEPVALVSQLGALGTSLTNSYAVTTVAGFSIRTQCPPPLVLADHPDAESISVSGCAAPCLWLMHEIEDTETRGAIVGMLSIMSFICCIIMLLYYLGSGQYKKQFKLVCLLGASFNVNWVLFAQVATIFSDSPTMCDDPGVGGGGYELTPCTVFAYLAIFLTISMCSWWLCVAIEIYFRVVKRTPSVVVEKYTPHCHVVSWGMGFICATSLAVLGELGYGGLSFCITHLDAPAEYEWLFFYGPIAAIVMVGTGFVSQVIWTTYKTQKAMADDETDSSMVGGVNLTPEEKREAKARKKAKLKKKLAVYRRPTLFIFVFWGIWGSVTMAKIINDSLLDETELGSEDFVRCLLASYSPLTSASNAHLSAQYCGAAPGLHGAARAAVHDVPQWILYVSECMVGGQGLFFFLIFGFDKKLIAFYSALLRGAGFLKKGHHGSSVNNSSHDSKKNPRRVYVGDDSEFGSSISGDSSVVAGSAGAASVAPSTAATKGHYQTPV